MFYLSYDEERHAAYIIARGVHWSPRVGRCLYDKLANNSLQVLFVRTVNDFRNGLLCYIDRDVSLCWSFVGII